MLGFANEIRDDGASRTARRRSAQISYWPYGSGSPHIEEYGGRWFPPDPSPSYDLVAAGRPDIEEMAPDGVLYWLPVNWKRTQRVKPGSETLKPQAESFAWTADDGEPDEGRRIPNTHGRLRIRITWDGSDDRERIYWLKWKDPGSGSHFEPEGIQPYRP